MTQGLGYKAGDAEVPSPTSQLFAGGLSRVKITSLMSVFRVTPEYQKLYVVIHVTNGKVMVTIRLRFFFVQTSMGVVWSVDHQSDRFANF